MCAGEGYCYELSESVGHSQSKNMASKLAWDKYMAKQAGKKRALLEKTFLFLFCIFSDFFHVALRDLKERTMAKLESSRLPTLVRLNMNIKKIVGDEWNEQLEAALLCVQHKI